MMFIRPAWSLAYCGALQLKIVTISSCSYCIHSAVWRFLLYCSSAQSSSSWVKSLSHYYFVWVNNDIVWAWSLSESSCYNVALLFFLRLDESYHFIREICSNAKDFPSNYAIVNAKSCSVCDVVVVIASRVFLIVTMRNFRQLYDTQFLLQIQRITDDDRRIGIQAEAFAFVANMCLRIFIRLSRW